MGRFLVSLALSILCVISTACSTGHGVQAQAEDVETCPKIGGTKVDGLLCYADSMSLVSSPEKYCNRNIVTFGYVRKSWAGLRLYPDRPRAEHQIVTSSILIKDPRAAAAIEAEIHDRSTGGAYLTFTAKFQCAKDKEVEKDVGVGYLDEFVRVAAADVDDNGEIVRERIIEDASDASDASVER